MKKYIITGLFVANLLALFTSCSDEQDVQINDNNSTDFMMKSDAKLPFTYFVDETEITRAKVQTWLSKYSKDLTNLESKFNVTFDTDNVQRLTYANDQLQVIALNQTRFDANDKVSYSVNFVDEGDEIVGLLLVESVVVAGEVITTNYYDFEGYPYWNLDTSDLSNVTFRSDPRQLHRTDCGSYTARCMADAATDYSWGSVVLVLASAWRPIIAAGVAVSCAYHHCVQYPVRASGYYPIPRK